MGLIASDGNLSKINNNIKIELKYDDIDILEKIKHEMRYENSIKDYEYNYKYKNGTSCLFRSARLNITNKKMYEKLIEYGIVPNKSNILDFDFSCMSPDLYKHFIRGYWDGNGHICVAPKGHEGSINLSVTGATKMIDSLVRIFSEVIPDFHYTINNRHPENMLNGTMYISRRKLSIKILNYLYRDATIYLDRKYNKYKEATELWTKLGIE